MTRYGKNGQALLEYVLALAGLLVVIGILSGFLGVSVRFSARANDLVATDYP